MQTSCRLNYFTLFCTYLLLFGGNLTRCFVFHFTLNLSYILLRHYSLIEISPTYHNGGPGIKGNTFDPLNDAVTSICLQEDRV